MLRIPPSGPVATIADLPAGANNQIVRTVGDAAAWTPGPLVADTVAAVNALDAFSADHVILRGLSAVGDEAGGVFELLPAGGLTADGFDVISLAAPHAPAQLLRVSSQPYNMVWANAESTATPLNVGVPAFCGTDHIGFGQGPWLASAPERWQWLGQDNTVLYVNVALSLTGTAGDEILADISPVSGGPFLTGLTGGVVAASGSLIIQGGNTLVVNNGDEFQLAFENLSGSNPVTLVTSLITHFKLKGNQDTLYL